jgi:hypothetical protein
VNYREQLIANGAIRPFGGKAIFRTDFAGRRSAALDILEWETDSVVRGAANRESTDPVVRDIIRAALLREAA